MIVRVGIPSSNGTIAKHAAQAGYPLLLSANSLWRDGKFRRPSRAIDGVDCALDSAGFVAMVRYGGYRWTVKEYVQIANAWPWAWYSSMDFCCEEGVASNRAEVINRVHLTSEYLMRVRTEACHQFAPMPMPILQGRLPADYLLSIKMTDDVLKGRWPDLIGVGSMCRRSAIGPESIGKVLTAIDDALPKHVGLHLFGVKGQALDLIRRQFPRVASIDSMAWDFAARREAGKQQISNSVHHRIKCMTEWVSANETKQQTLWEIA